MSVEQISLRFETFQRFLDRCSPHVSEEGMFLPTDDIRPVGTTVEFDLGLGSDFPILRGRGEVVWVEEAKGEGEAAGMAVRYLWTDEATATLARRIAERQRLAAAPVFELARAGETAGLEPEPPVAPLVADVADVSDVSDIAESVAVDRLTMPDDAESTPALSAIEKLTGEEAVDAAMPMAFEPDAPVLQIPGVDSASEGNAPAPAARDAAATVPDSLEARVLAEAERVEAKKGHGGRWAALALLVVLAGAGYLQRGWIQEKFEALSGGDRPEEASPGAPEPISEPEATGGPDTAVEPGTESTDPASQAPASRAAAGPAAQPAAVVVAPVTGPVTGIEDISWITDEGSTLITLRANGLFEADGFTVERLDDPPRVLLKIPGIARPLERPTRAVGSEEVVGVRTGLHELARGNQLHVVVDLASPTAQVTSTVTNGALLQVRISSTAIAP